MLASRLVGTTERSMSSMCATQALSEVSLRSSTEANVLPPFTRHSLRVPYRWWGRIQDRARPIHPRYLDMSEEMAEWCHRSLTGVVTPAQATETLRKELSNIV